MNADQTASLESILFAIWATVVPTKIDSDVILCLQLLGRKLTRTLHFIESWDHVLFKSVYPFLVFRFDKIGFRDLHTKSLEVSCVVYVIFDLYLFGIQSSTLIY